jgi:hypothetical protein
MDASRAAVVVVGVNLIAVWAWAAAGGRMGPPPGTITAPRAAADVAVGEARAALVAAAGRLEAHARGQRVTPPITRDPFQFGSLDRAVAHRAPGASAAAAPSARPQAAASPALPAEPEIVLQGMAESQDGEAVVRTAVVRAGPDLVLATLGTRIGERYEVVALSSDAVELEDLASHARRTCRMK